MGCGEAVASRCYPRTVAPGHTHVNPISPKFHRRLGIVVEEVGVPHVVRGYRNHGRVKRGEAGNRRVARRRYQRHVTEVGKVSQLVEYTKIILLRRAKAQVADVHLVLYRPAKPSSEDAATPTQHRPKHSDTVELAL